MWSSKITRANALRQRLAAARDDLITREEDADEAAVQLAEANESVLYAKERVSRLIGHLKVALDEEDGKAPNEQTR